MSHVAPLGPMYQAGTLSGNPVAMAAGAKTIQLLSEPDTYQTLKQKTEHLAQGLQQALTESETPATINHTTGMLTLFLGIPNNVIPAEAGIQRGGAMGPPPLREARTQGVPAQTSVYDMTTASTNDRATIHPLLPQHARPRHLPTPIPLRSLVHLPSPHPPRHRKNNPSRPQKPLTLNSPPPL